MSETPRRCPSEVAAIDVASSLNAASRTGRPSPSATSSSAIDDLSVHYGTNLALGGVDLDVYKNLITAMIGPSGCGKSTFIRCLNRMNDLVPGVKVGGKILYHGEDLYGSDADPGRGAPADRHGLPEAEPVPEVDPRQRRLRAEGARA